MNHKNQIPLYKKILGDNWNMLPEEIRVMHNVLTSSEAEGIATIEGGNNPLAKLVRLLVGLPSPNTNVSVNINFSVKNGIETWTRKFNGKPFRTTQYAGQGALENCILERFGIMTFVIKLMPENNRLDLNIEGWFLLGIPMPKWLGVRSETYETVENGRFVFNVKISHPFMGLIVHYRGWLIPKSQKSELRT